VDQRDTTGGYIPPQQPIPPKKSTRKGLGCLAAAVVFVAIVAAITVAARGGSGDNTASTGVSTTATATDDSYTSIPILPVPTSALPTTADATVAAQVTYACTGSAPDGLDITYGPSGSNYSASSLPFTKTQPLDDTAQYYVTEAQLSGSGQVTCTTTIQRSDGSQVVNTATASGSYNIASAQICSTYDGGWEKC
jgi:hypothetical protein